MLRETAHNRAIRGPRQTRATDMELAQLARAQHGVVARWQLVRLGLGSDAVDRRASTGRLHRLYEGVYAVGHRALTLEGWWMAAVLASGPGNAGPEGSATSTCVPGANPSPTGIVLSSPAAVLSHRSAAALWRIRRPTDGAAHVTLARKSRSTGQIRRHYRRLPPDEVTVHEGIPVTTVPRTIFDLAATSSADVVEFALREAEYLHLHDALSVPDLLARYPGRRGARRARLALARLAERTGRVRSPLEEVFVPFLRRHRLPRPRLNAWLEVGGRRHQIDCLWPADRLIAELDGWEGHGTRAAFHEDRARDRRLQTAGYRVTRLTWNQLEDEPETIASDLRALLGA